MVEMWLNRAHEEIEAGNKNPAVKPTIKMYTIGRSIVKIESILPNPLTFYI